MTNDTATPEKKALLDAFDAVLKTQVEEREAQLREEEARRAARARSRPIMWLCAVILLFLGAYLWVEQPDWVFPTKALPESAEVKEASLRIAMANAAQHVERFRQRYGRLPGTLAEAGAHGDGMVYETIGSADWRLTGGQGPTRLTLNSRKPIAEFLGNSFDVIARRGR